MIGYFVLRQGGPIDIASAIRVVGGGLTISLSVIMGLPAVLLAAWIAIFFSRTPFTDYLALRWTSWQNFLIGAVSLAVLVAGWWAECLIRALISADALQARGDGAAQIMKSAAFSAARQSPLLAFIASSLLFSLIS